jgi:hypothetical protein
MSEINNGGAAFPLMRSINGSDGMTLRDYFAAKALTTMFYPAIMESIRTDVDLDCDRVAGFAYTMADAMLKARGQG